MNCRKAWQTPAKCASKASNSSTPNDCLGMGPRKSRPDPGPREGLSRARPRAGPARSQRSSSSLRTARDPRADAQTDRRRGAGRSPAAARVCESKEGRTPVTLSPCSAGQGALNGTWTSQLCGAGGGGVASPFLRHCAEFVLYLFALSRRPSPVQGLWKIRCKIDYRSAFFLLWCREGPSFYQLLKRSTLPERLRTPPSSPGPQGLILGGQGGAFQIGVFWSYICPQGSWL